MKDKFDVKLFDCTFYSNWTDNEIIFNTSNKQYLPTEYSNSVIFNQNNIYDELQSVIDEFKPDAIFWSAISSHIHGEGEYVNIQYGHELLSKIRTNGAKLITAGLQATASPKTILQKYPKIDYLNSGESEFVLLEFMNNINNNDMLEKLMV